MANYKFELGQKVWTKNLQDKKGEIIGVKLSRGTFATRKRKPLYLVKGAGFFKEDLWISENELLRYNYPFLKL